MKSTYLNLRTLQPNRLQRLLLFGSATVWFLSAVISAQRNYQDSWILESIFWPFVGFTIVFLLVLWLENDNRIVAILCALAVIVMLLIPSLKYKQLYGQAIDAVVHYQVTKNLIITGRVASQEHVYQAIAGMHSWLASLGLTSGLAAAEAIKIGFPLLGGILPLLVYWISRRTLMPSELTKYIICLSCLTTYPYHLPTGTGFTIIPVVLLLGVLVLREYYSTSETVKITYTIIALIALSQITIWHSTTPILLPILMVSISFTPVWVWLATGRNKKVGLSTRFLQMGVLATIVILGYHAITTDPVFVIVISNIYQAIYSESDPVILLPSSLFQITPLEVIKVFLMMYGREALLFFLSALGLFVIWRKRALFGHFLYFYAYLSMIFITFLIAFPVTFFGIDYRRLMWIPLAFTPFFAGFGLWWWNQRVSRMSTSAQLRFRGVGFLLLVIAIGVFVMEFYNYQPLIPKSISLTPDTPNEYVVWLHQVNSAYQQRMITFAETFSTPEMRFDTDILSNRQYIRYYDEIRNRGLYLPLAPDMGWLDQGDTPREKLFLLHWPGKAGGFFEQVVYRSVDYLTKLRNTAGWGLIYDNGESYILLTR